MSVTPTPLLTPPDATKAVPTDAVRALGRRHLLRGGAVLAGAAGVAVVGAIAPTPASASVPYLELGTDNGSDLPTLLQVGGPDGIAEPALRLENANGPSLSLQPLSENWNGPLNVGDIVNTTYGPVIGVDYGDGATKDALVTTHYLATLPVTIPIPPFRILDTRQPNQTSIVGMSADGRDAEGRVKGGAWLDVGFAETNDGYTLIGLFVNVTVPLPTANGHLTVYPGGGSRPSVSSLSYQTGKSTSNGALVATGVVGNVFALRIWVSKTTHLVLDVSGVSITAVPSTPAPPVSPARVDHRPGQLAAVKALKRALGN